MTKVAQCLSSTSAHTQDTMEENEIFVSLLDRNKLESVISSPDSAIDMTEEIQVAGRPLVLDIIHSLLDEVHRISSSNQKNGKAQPNINSSSQIKDNTSKSHDNQVSNTSKRLPRASKKKRAPCSTSEGSSWQAAGMLDCPLTGWRRILARNSDSDGGWGFNFIAPTGVRLNGRELDQFLKLRKLSLSELCFQEMNSVAAEDVAKYPRKAAVLKIGIPVEKIRDLKLSKKMELERRRAKLAQQKLETASRPQFNSISEYLANLEKEEQDLLEEEQAHERSYATCSGIVQFCLDTIKYESTNPNWLLPNHSNPRLLSPTQGMKKTEDVSPSRSIEKLKIRIGDPDHPEPPIQKIKITPEKLASKKKTKLKTSKSKKGKSPEKKRTKEGGLKVKILTPKSRKTLKYTQKKEGKKLLSPSSKDKTMESSSISPPKKYSFFKSKNSGSASKSEAKTDDLACSPQTQEDTKSRSRSKSMNLSSYDEFDEEDVTDLSTVNTALKHARKSSETQQLSVAADASGVDLDISSKIEAAKSNSNKRITRVSSSDARSTIRDLSSMVSSTATAARSRSMDATQPPSGAAATSGAPAKRKRRGTDHYQPISQSNLTVSTSPTPPPSIDDSSLLSSSLDSHNTDDDHDVSTASANFTDVEINDDTMQSEDLDDIEDEFSAEQGPLQSPNKVLNIVLASPSKLPVMEKYTANKAALTASNTTPPTSVSSIETASSSIGGSLESSPSPSRRLVFGLHSPVCKDEIIRPELNKIEVNLEINKEVKKHLNIGLNKEINNRVEEEKYRTMENEATNTLVVKPKAASRTKSRVISSEDAIMAMDAIIDIQTIPSTKQCTTSKINQENQTLPEPRLINQDNNPTPPLTISDDSSSPLNTPNGTTTNTTPLPDMMQHTPTIPELSPHINTGSGNLLPTPNTSSLPLLSPQVVSNINQEDTHSTLTTPSLPSLSPAVTPGTTLPMPQQLSNSPLAAVQPPTTISSGSPPVLTSVTSVTKVGKSVGESRRESGEGKLMRPDPDLSQPLSVMIPTPQGQRKGLPGGQGGRSKPGRIMESREEKENVSQKEKKDRSTENTTTKLISPTITTNHSTTTTTSLESSTIFTSKSPPKTPETATGRKMRGCRQFIHYEFSPPFVISDDSSTDQDSPVSMVVPSAAGQPIIMNGESHKGVSKKGKGRPRKTLESGLDGVRGGIEKKRKGKDKILEAKEALNISELAQRLSEDHISPITRERVNFLKEDSKKSIKRRTSIDLSSLQSTNKRGLKSYQNGGINGSSTSSSKRSVNRSKSTDVKEDHLATVGSNGLEMVKEQLLFSQQLLMKTILPTVIENGLDRIIEEKAVFPIKDDLLENDDIKEEVKDEIKTDIIKIKVDHTKSNANDDDSAFDSFSGTLFVKKRVRVQSPSDPLAKIKDLVRSNSREDIKTKSKANASSIQDKETCETKDDNLKGDISDAGESSSADSQTADDTSSTTRSSTRQGRGAAGGAVNRKKRSSRQTSASKQMIKHEDAALNEDGLVDGLRVLVRIDGHFYPGRLNTINPPDIYGVLLDNERGFKPHIYAREELLKNVIRDVRVNAESVAVGTRVCAYWSSKYVYLHPGTVVNMELDSKHPPRFENIELDDGDSREISIDQLRYLPINYPKVEDGESSMLHSPGKIKRKSHSPHPARTREESPLSIKHKEISPLSVKTKDESLIKNDDSTKIKSKSNNFKEMHKKAVDIDNTKEATANNTISKTNNIGGNKPATSISNDLFAGKIGNMAAHSKDAAGSNRSKVDAAVAASRSVAVSSASGGGYKKNIEPAANSGPVDLVGLISKGIDRLVEKKVGGSRPDWSSQHPSPAHPGHNTPMHRPQYPQFPHPGFGRPGLPPGTPMHPSSGGGGMYPPASPQHFPQHYGGSPPPSPFHPSQSPHPYQSPHQHSTGYMPPASPYHHHSHPSPSPHHFQAPQIPVASGGSSLVYPPYMPPRPTMQPNSSLVPSHIPTTSTAGIESTLSGQSLPPPSPSPSQGSSCGDEDVDEEVSALPEPETNRKVASRLSNLIAAVSGKISSKPAITSSSSVTTHTNSRHDHTQIIAHGNHGQTGLDNKYGNHDAPSLDKWKSAFDSSTSLNSLMKANNQLTKVVSSLPVSQQAPVMMEEFEEGFLNVNRMLVGTKILFYKDKQLHPAIISSIEEDDYVITFRCPSSFTNNSQDINKAISNIKIDKDDLIGKAVMDIPALSTDKLKTGSRVAVFPVQNCGYLQPGTVRKIINAYLIQVTLDAGPIKDINCDHVKIIPTSFIRKPTFDSKIDKDALKNMSTNNSLINKKKPNILLGYDYVDTDKSDLQNSWESAISRKSSKRPEKKVEPAPSLTKPVLVVPEKLTEKKQEEKPKKVLEKESVKKPKIKSEKPTSTKTITSESNEEIKKVVKDTLNSLVHEVTAEEKLRQSLIFGALKKWSPTKGGTIKPTKIKVKKKKKLKDGERTSSIESSGSDDVTQELLSICKESNINTPNKNCLSETERIAWQQRRPPIPAPTSTVSTQPPASTTDLLPIIKSEQSSSEMTIVSKENPLDKTNNVKVEDSTDIKKDERSLDDIVRATIAASQEKAKTTEISDSNTEMLKAVEPSDSITTNNDIEASEDNKVVDDITASVKQSKNQSIVEQLEYDKSTDSADHITACAESTESLTETSEDTIEAKPEQEELVIVVNKKDETIDSSKTVEDVLEEDNEKCEDVVKEDNLTETTTNLVANNYVAKSEDISKPESLETEKKEEVCFEPESIRSNDLTKNDFLESEPEQETESKEVDVVDTENMDALDDVLSVLKKQESESNTTININDTISEDEKVNEPTEELKDSKEDNKSGVIDVSQDAQERSQEIKDIQDALESSDAVEEKVECTNVQESKDNYQESPKDDKNATEVLVNGVMENDSEIVLSEKDPMENLTKSSLVKSPKKEIYTIEENTVIADEKIQIFNETKDVLTDKPEIKIKEGLVDKKEISEIKQKVLSSEETEKVNKSKQPKREPKVKKERKKSKSALEQLLEKKTNLEKMNMKEAKKDMASKKEDDVKEIKTEDLDVTKPDIIEKNQHTANNNKVEKKIDVKADKPIAENDNDIEIIDEKLVTKATMAKQSLMKRIKEMKIKKAQNEKEVEIVEEKLLKKEDNAEKEPLNKLETDTENKKEVVVKKPPSKEEVVVKKPPSKEEVVVKKPPSKEEVVVNKPPSKEEVVVKKPPSKEEVVVKKPPSKEEVVVKKSPVNKVKVVKKSEENNTKKKTQKKKKETGQKPGHVDNNTFYYRDPAFPERWFIRVAIRTCGNKADSYYYTPCRTLLRSYLQIEKFLKGTMPSKPSKKVFIIDFADMPLKEELCEKDLKFTHNFKTDFFDKLMEKPSLTNGLLKDTPKNETVKESLDSPVKKQEDDSIDKSVKDQDEESFNNSAKEEGVDTSAKEDYTVEEAAEQKMTDDNCFKIPNEENLRMLRSRRSASKKDLDDQNEDHNDDQTNDIEDTDDHIDNVEIKSENVKSEDVTVKPNVEHNESNNITDEKTPEIIESELKTEVKHSPIKKKLRSNDILSKKKLRNGKLTKSPKKKLLKIKDKKQKKPAVSKLNFDSIVSASKETDKKGLKLKNSGDDISNNDAVDKCKVKEEDKLIAQKTTAIKDIEVNESQTKVSNKRHATPTEEEVELPKSKKAKSEDLTPKSENSSPNSEKSSPNRMINRGPASKRKLSSTDSDSNDADEVFEPETKSPKLDSQQLTDNAIHSDSDCVIDDHDNDEKSDLFEDTSDATIHKCAAKLVKVFKQGGLLEASCGNCQEAGCYSPESVEIDIPGSLIIMECTICAWTTVRRISVANRLI